MVTDPDRARAQPEISALSALAHGGRKDTGEDVLLAFAESLCVLPADRGPIYHDYVVDGLSKTARAFWETLMTTGTYTFKSEFARYHHQSGYREGEAKGEAKGEARGEANAMLAVLATRGLDVTDEQRQRITSCTDTDLLLRWTKRAVTADSTDEVLAS
ncbi:hypothetical protein [Nocardiopsis baichengensis]|uniref:hypothetical protein n=1 Tax=Nocardiopsis baichengensis TaxID=280240 RepID=UPI001EF9DC6A|nr:hypothetical protein [Nocardiopsis baichengensis]